MIKLPVVLESRNNWLEVLARTVQQRDELEKRAVQFRAETGRYIRPIALLQAQPKSKSQETHTVAVIRQTLIERLKVPVEHIRIATGEHDDLGNVNLSDEKSPVRYVITVDKLREGWDCPFAYVLGSVGNVATETAVEQLLGRVMRMPHATPTGVQELDRAYAVVRSEDVLDTAQRLRDSLVKRCGFDADSSRDALRVHRQDQQGLLFKPDAIFVSAPPDLKKLPPEVRSKVKYDESTKELHILTPLLQSDALFVQDSLPEADRAALDDYWQENRNVGTTAKRLNEYAEPIRVPQLVVRDGKSCTLFVPEELKEFNWNLDDCDTTISKSKFSTEAVVGKRVELEVNELGGVAYGTPESVLSQRFLFGSKEDYWSKGALAAWLDDQIHLDRMMTSLPKTQSTPWLQRVIDSLLTQRKCELSVLVLKRSDLFPIVKAMLSEHRRKQVRRATESLTGGHRGGRRLETSSDAVFVLDEQRYAPFHPFPDAVKFKRHAFDLVGSMGNEEILCASQIDAHSNVKRWIRNLEHESAGGFSLPLSPGHFFPDFIVELNDGRIAMIEYKNPVLNQAASEQHKKSVGELWAERSDRRCVFAWIVDKDWTTLEKVLAAR